MKVLVLSNTPWANDNSFGNSFSNIFSGIPEVTFGNIFCRYGEAKNDLDMRCFQITERSMLRNLKNSSIPSGKEVEKGENSSENLDIEPIVGFDQARIMRWQIMFWARDAVWKIGRWNSPELRAFLDDFHPDLIFQPVYYSNYLCEIALFIKEYTGAPMIGYISDDNYTLRQFQLSPLYWVDRFHKRKKVRAVIEKCDLLYVISEIQKEEYERIFTPKCKILTKCSDFSCAAPEYPMPQKPLKLLYAGNIGTGRWKSLKLIVNAVEKLNQHGVQIQLDIYTATPQTEAMKSALNKKGCALHGSILLSEVQKLQRESDVVIHVEGLSLKSRLAVHQSFSTKLVDYFAIGKCILAIGTEDEASIKHLKDNDAAIVCSSQEEVSLQLERLATNPELILDYGKKAYVCGRIHHDKQQMQKMLIEDMSVVMARK